MLNFWGEWGKGWGAVPLVHPLDSRQSLILTKTLLFPHKPAYFLNESHDSYKNEDNNSKFYITNLIPF